MNNIGVIQYPVETRRSDCTEDQILLEEGARRETGRSTGAGKGGREREKVK